MTDDNMSLWKQVESTNPKWTNDFNKGGFKGTSVNQIWQTEQATKLFGPKGIGWGDRELEHVIVEGAIPEGATCAEKVWMTHLELWYFWDDCEGKVEQWGSAPLLQWVKTGKYMRFNDEAAKMAHTNAVSKCLSQLGFSADLWKRYYDSPEYRRSAGELADERERLSKEEVKVAQLTRGLTDWCGCKTDADFEAVCRWVADVTWGEASTDGAVASKVMSAMAKKVKSGTPYAEFLAAAKG